MRTIEALLCVLFIAECAFGQNCNGKMYSLSAPEKCPVEEVQMINFAIKSTTPDQTGCKPTETVCVNTERLSTTVAFSGTVTDAVKLIAFSAGTNTVQLPVVRVADKQSFAEPPVAVFPTAEVPADNVVSLTVSINTPVIKPMAGVTQGTAETACGANTLCYLVADKTIKFWGTRGAIESVQFNGADGAFVVIPLVTKAAMDINPEPRVLSVPTDGKIAAAIPVMLPVVVDTITAVTGGPVPKADCKEAQLCYEVILAPSIATFKGVMPAAPLTIQLKGNTDQEYVSYLFGNAGNMLKNGVLALTLASSAVYMSLI